MGLTPAGFMPHNSINGARASAYRLPLTTMEPILMQRDTELCYWLPCTDDIVSCSYGSIEKPAMTLYARVSPDVAQSQMQAHLDHGWEIVLAVCCGKLSCSTTMPTRWLMLMNSGCRCGAAMSRRSLVSLSCLIWAASTLLLRRPTR
jgi:hypothetical protein